MASINVLDWIDNNLRYIGKDALEVGAKKHKDHTFLDLREFISSRKLDTALIGCDIESGENVDVIFDLSADSRSVNRAINHMKFDTIFCISVLEHIPDVFSASKNISNLLKPGGSLFISVPFVFRYHGYPGDFWRFTPEAVTHLFPEFDFLDLRRSNISSLAKDDVMNLSKNRTEKINRFIYRPKEIEKKLARKEMKIRGTAVEPYSLAPCMINMLGIKK